MSNMLNITAIYETPQGLGHIAIPINLDYFHPSWCDEEILDNIYPQVFQKMTEEITGEREFIGLDITNEELIDSIHDYFV